MNRLFSAAFENVKRFQFGNVKNKSGTSNQIEVVDLESFLKKYERRLYQFQNIVFWESPLLSCGITVVLTLVFYFLSYCSWKFFASLFSLLLILCVSEVWVDRIWPEIAVESPSTEEWLPVNERSYSAAEISQKMSLVKENLDRYWKWLINLRREKPSIFCLSTSFILLTCIATTWYISGLTLVYLTMLGVLCGPALVKQAAKSPVVQEYVNSVLCLLSTCLADTDEVDEKIIPHVTEESKKYLDLDCASPVSASLDSLDPTHNLSELGVAAMPSHEDVCLDRTTGDEFALPHGEPAELPNVDLYTPPLSSNTSSASLVSDALDNDDMEHSCTPTSTSHLVMTLGTNSGLRQRRHASTTDDDSEFEMIEHSDVNPKS